MATFVESSVQTDSEKSCWRPAAKAPTLPRPGQLTACCSGTSGLASVCSKPQSKPRLVRVGLVGQGLLSVVILFFFFFLTFFFLCPLFSSID